MSRFLSNRFASMQPYTPGEQPQNRQYVKLNTNESPFPPAPGVIDALSRTQAEKLNLYPDPDARAATDAIAAYYGLRRENVLLGNGSDEILYFCFAAFCDNVTPACFADITYGFYEVFAQVLGIPTRILPLNDELEIVSSDYANLKGTLFIANPNAPTGQALTLIEIESILNQNPCNVVVVDEAYVDFGAQSASALIERYENLIVVQTMSKSRNLAGARLGFALASPALIADLNMMKFSFNPYNVNRLSLLAAEAAMLDKAYFENCTNEIMRVRAYTQKELTKRGFTVLPSKTNFLFAKPSRMEGDTYYRALKEKGVLVRHFQKPRISDYVRITIGTEAQMQTLLKATDEIWEEQA